MTAPDAPTAMTLEEAIRRVSENGWSLTFDYLAGVCVTGDNGHSLVASTWRTWPEAVSQALGYPVVERDPTAELVEENAELRRILSECATAAGASAAPTCSLSFFGELPREITLRRVHDTAELVEALEAVTKAEYDSGVGEYAMTVATMRLVLAALAAYEASRK